MKIQRATAPLLPTPIFTLTSNFAVGRSWFASLSIRLLSLSIRSGLKTLKLDFAASSLGFQLSTWNNVEIYRATLLLDLWKRHLKRYKRFFRPDSPLAPNIKGRAPCFSMQVVMNKCFLLNPEKKIGTDPSCCFREKHKTANFNSEKWSYRAEG